MVHTNRAPRHPFGALVCSSLSLCRRRRGWAPWPAAPAPILLIQDRRGEARGSAGLQLRRGRRLPLPGEQSTAKMSKGIPLTDTDRAPWLESLCGAIRDRLDRGEDVAVSCSALQHKYREVLREGDSGYIQGSYATCRVKFVCLEASAELIAARVQRRAKEGGHFMPASLVQSQLDLLEIDEAEGITVVDATVRPNAIVEATIAQFREELASTALLTA